MNEPQSAGRDLDGGLRPHSAAARNLRARRYNPDERRRSDYPHHLDPLPRHIRTRGVTDRAGIPLTLALNRKAGAAMNRSPIATFLMVLGGLVLLLPGACVVIVIKAVGWPTANDGGLILLWL